jgi:hypothetical protein
MDGLDVQELTPSGARIFLKDVMQTELYLPRRRADTTDPTKIVQRWVGGEIRYRIIGVSITGNIEDIEKVSTEPNYLFMPYVKVFEQRSINLPITRSAFGAVVCGAKRE